MKLKQTLLSLILSLVLLGSGMSISSALDTDIYFLDPSAGTTLVKPNLTLILDTSGSMNENVSGTTQMRLDIMKQAMLSVLDEMTDVNVGLMRFTNNAGGPVVYPVENLETVVTDTGNIQSVIQDSQDDAEQTVSSGSVNTTNSTIYLHTNGGAEREAGFRFRNTYIPQGVTITSAKIVFKAGGSDSDTVNLRIRADKVADAPIYTATTSNISSRAQTTAFVDWSVGSWSTDDFYETPDLTSVVQEAVNQTDWCRGNAMAFTFKRNGVDTGQRRVRAYDTYDNNGFDAPQAALVVTYDPSTVPTTSSCHQIVRRVNQGSDDAEERATGTGGMTLTGSVQLIRSGSQNQIVGVRFQNIKIPSGATITSAALEFEVDSTNTASTSLTIKGEASGNPTTFLDSDANISSRSTTTASVAWSNLPNLAVNQKLVAPDIKTIVQELVNRSDWASDNAMAFIITGSGTKNVESYDSEPAAAPLLRVTYSASTATQKTVRDQIKELIVPMRAEANTPIVDALYEAALYYRGNDMDYGKTRSPSSGTDTRARWTRVSHPGSYTGGTLSLPSGCTAADPDSASCIAEEITGTPVYISPIVYECQSNHIVLLTDGAATANNSTSKIQTMAGISSCSGSGNEACGVSLTSYLSNQDQSSLSDLQTVRTHTIGININNTFLSDLAANGNGFYRTANDANEVITAFTSILNEVLKNPTSFVSPSLSVNAFNRLYNRDEVYFTLFSPQLSVAWPGNVKKYTLCSDDSCTFGEVMDNSSPAPLPAIDPVTSKIKSTATSFWSSTGDGPEVKVGGAGSQVTAYGSRRAYTYTGSSDAPASPVDLSGSAHVVDTGNSAITQSMLGATSSGERTAIIDWMRGQDLEDEDSDGVTNEMRWAFADALHSRPATIGYGGTAASPVIKIVVGTNDGGVRMIDAATGQEDWIVYLPEFLSKHKDLKDNSNGIHIASVDGSPTIRTVDNNNDGIIDPNAGDKVQMFIGMRRGVDASGKGYLYAFDLTPDTSPLTTSSAIGTVKPKFMWRISSASTGLGALGQTWSRPLLTNVYVKCPTGDASCDSGISGQKDSKVRSVLLFGGGYDPAFDTKLGGTGEGLGNAIYIVDPDTGSRMWWAGGPSSGADLELANMKYSIPSDLALLDSDRDGITDRIYVGDLHGQLWRIDLSNQIDPDATSAGNRNGGSQDPTVGYVFADVGCTSGDRSTDCTATSNQNRVAFFYPPDVAQIIDEEYASSGNTTYDYVTIGTGDREDPLDKKTQAVSQEAVHNRIYAFRDSDYKLGPPKVGTTITIPAAITEADLHNADANALSDPSGSGYAAALSDIQSKKGWFINLKESSAPTWIGEKVLARTTIFAGVLYATTYVPPQSGGTPTVCGAPAEGTARQYSLNLLNASGVYNSSGSRSGDIGGGIPSELVIVIREGGTSGLIGTSGGAKLTQPPKDLPQRRTYWYQE
jgi:type IV pilus assembly protein PilY1